MFGWEEDGAVSPWGASVDLSILDGSSGFALEGSTAGGHFGWVRVGSMLIMAFQLGKGGRPRRFTAPQSSFWQQPEKPLRFCASPRHIDRCWCLSRVSLVWGVRYVRTQACTVLLRLQEHQECTIIVVVVVFRYQELLFRTVHTLTMIFKCQPANNRVSGGPQTAFTQYCIQWLFDSKSRGATCPFPINFVF